MNDLLRMEDLMDVFYGKTGTRTTASKKMLVNYDTTDDGYVVKAELPGVEEENIDINVENGMLTISANYESKDELTLREGRYKWSASIQDIDTDAIDATLDKGILTINLPKSEKAKPKRIAIGKK